jgi:NAD(P)-dependent dehydrogenase (short-subunit alcohol dehydrogenase family)
MTQDLEGRVVFITGANTGIGRAAAVALAKRGAKLYLAGRSEERHAEVLAELRGVGQSGTYLPLDLGDLSSVRACAEKFLALEEPLHVLINNAGLAGPGTLTVDGFERTFGVNHLGPFLLTELLLERLKSSAPSRIVNVASKGHYRAEKIDWDAVKKPTKSATGLDEYQVSKLCNVLYAKELAARLEGTGVTTYSLHPGVIASDVWRQVPWGFRQLMTMFMKSNEEGAATTLHCATSEAAGKQSGLYYDECKVKEPSSLAMDAELANELVKRSRELVGI